MKERIHWQLVIQNGFFFISSSMLLALKEYDGMTILFMLLVLIFMSSFYLIANAGVRKLLLVAYIILGIFLPEFLFFIPAMVSVVCSLDYSLRVSEIIAGSLLIAFVFVLQPTKLLSFGVIGLWAIFAAYLAERYWLQRQLYQKYLVLKDDSWEKQRQLEEKNNQLLLSQETSVDLEITKERNRIARDIHDNVGHLLSSALIQLGAVQTINQQANLEAPLKQLQATVDLGMNNIRSSVHNTFRDSLDFNESLNVLLKDFKFCPVKIIGDFSEIPQKYVQPLTMIIKEALSNVMKHSQAREVKLIFSELPGFYKCVISNNGVIMKENQEKGIGLIGMEQRLQKLSGQLHTIQQAEVFSINIILPKEEMGESDD
ncbi:two-component system sensor histidine kinase DesK [Enterococcus sp. PF1-24]|uniref:sensor histidine kinase n=1 Tax=unclassified Enterococcus TaxID=2608891 RepID=UPI00247581DB|nr:MULTISPECIES: histidine kinase [unclassified Enterococcus]MDH6365535.1 two-component system sensor histidine kinase DesK [Enterococcus sp. PFB1-1]MDH6402636.1 two-component system sensor histidine kinase DesK [Enterococcus sp. PF1-24]